MNNNRNIIHVLVVEDEPHHFEMIRRILQGYPQFGIHWQQSLRSTKIFLDRFKPDIILCDLKLPDGEGIDLIKHSDDICCPVLFLTAHRDDRSAVTAIKAGAMDFLTKEPEQLARLPLLLTSVYYQWQAKEAIRKQEKEVQLQRLIAENIFMHVNVGLLLLDESYTIQAVNPYFHQLFGVEAAHFQKGSAISSPEIAFAQRLLAIVNEQRNLSYPIATLIQVNSKDIEVHLRKIIDPTGNTAFLLLFYDISTYTARNRMIEIMLNLASFSGGTEEYLQVIGQEFRKLICFDFFLAAKYTPSEPFIQKVYGSTDFHSFINQIQSSDVLNNLLKKSQSFLLQVSNIGLKTSVKLDGEIQSLIGVPLKSQPALPFNLFLFGKSKPDQFSIDDLHLIESLSHQVLITFERLLLQERESEQRKTAEALLRFISLISEEITIEEILRRTQIYLKDYINCSYSQVWIIQKVDFETTPIVQVFEGNLSYRLPLYEVPLFESFYQKAQNGMYVFKHDEIDPESQILLPEAKVYLFLPVFLKKGYAVITLIAFEEENIWLEDKANIFSAFASQIAHLIRSANLIKENQELALVDELTGLYNRRGLNLLAEREFNSSVQNQTPLSICFCDINDFKKFNDQYSYQTGDLALQSVAKIIRSEMRNADFAARFGGDEFIIFLPRTPQSKTQAIIQRIQKSLEQTTIPYKNQQLKITLTFGVSEISPSDTDWTSIAARAASQMQENKRNR